MPALRAIVIPLLNTELPHSVFVWEGKKEGSMNKTGNHKNYILSYNILRNAFSKSLISTVTYAFPQQNHFKKMRHSLIKKNLPLS